jgi:adenylate kinase family enzyme
MNKKIMIMGISGSGKSTLAKELNTEFGIPVFHLDMLMMNQNWRPKDKEEQREIHSEILKNTSWIIEGNWSTTINDRVQEADMIIYLDCSLATSLYRVTKRLIMNFGKQRSDTAIGCVERFSLEFYLYIIKFYFTKRKKYIKRYENMNDARFHYVKHPNQKKLEKVKHLASRVLLTTR